MDQISCFRGMAGEIVRDFIRPSTLLCAVPLTLAIVLFRFAASWPSVGYLVTFSLLFLAYVFQTARFALAARDGTPEPCRDMTEILHFTGRSALLGALLLLPLLPFTFLILRKNALPSLQLLTGPLPLFSAGFPGILVVICILMWSFLPPLALLLATRFSDLPALFSRTSWDWLARERRCDLATFYAAFFGGAILIFLVYLLPLGAVAALFMQMSPRIGVSLGMFLYLLPVTASPKLLGRLCGIFVAGERIADAVRVGSVFTPTIVAGSLPRETLSVKALKQTTISREPKPDLYDLLRKVEALAGDEVLTAKRAVEEALSSTDQPLRYTAELALIERRTGDTEQAAMNASAAINLAAQRGLGDVGLGIFRLFNKERSSLTLTPYAQELLGSMLLKQESFLDAAWCYHTAATTAGDSLKAQKKLLQVAQAAEKSGKDKDAAALYDFFINTYPMGNFTGFAREGRDRLKA